MDRLRVVKVSLLVAMGIVPFTGCSDDEGPDNEGAAGSGEAGEGPQPGGSGGSGGTKQVVGGEAGMAPVVGGGGTTSGPAVGKCTSPTADEATGLVKCAEGFSHRPEPATCGDANVGGQGGAGSELPRAPNNVPCGAGGAGGGAGEDCSDYYLGYCKEFFNPEAPGECASGCVQDSDCAEGYACVCGDTLSPSGGACVPANCLTDDDCGDGLLCSMWQDTCGQPWLSCQTPDDECVSDDDCDAGTCEVLDTARACSDSVCGRPFLVDALARTAPVVDCSAWATQVDSLPSLVGLSEQDRAAMAAHFSKLGQMEHASIAAFARFNLQLLALGAPPELVEACTAAMADETAHTRLCFAIASHYAGRALGPGRLEIAGSLEAISLLEVAKLVIAEGCLGETVAAVEALESAETCGDAALRSAYTRIAADEQRHAELAFRFMRYAIDQAPTEVGALIESELGSLPDSPAVRGVVAPCLRALLGTVSHARASDSLAGERGLSAP